MNIMVLDKSKYLHLGQGNPKLEYRLGDKRTESSPPNLNGEGLGGVGERKALH